MSKPGQRSSVSSWCFVVLAVAYVAGSMLEQPGVTAPTPGYVIAAGGLLAILVGAALPFMGLAPVRFRIALWVFGFVAWAGLASLVSIERHDSSVVWASWVGMAALLCALLLGVRSTVQARFAVWSLVLVSAAATAYGATTLGTGEALHDRLSSTFTNPDCFSVVPLVGLLLASGLFEKSRGPARALLFAISLGLCAAVAFTGSRSGLVGTVSGGLFFLGHLVLRKSREGPARGRRLASTLIPLLGAFLAALLILALWLPSNPLVSRLMRLTQEPRTWSARWDAFRLGLLAFCDRPVLGSGPGTFHLAYQPYRGQDGIEEYYNVAHNDHLEVLVETGAVGLLLWLGLLAACVRAGVGRASSTTETFAASSAVVGVSVYALGNFALPVPAAALWWMAASGLAATSPRQSPGSSPRWLRAMVALLLVAAGALVLFRGLKVEQARAHVLAAEELKANLELESAYEEMTRAVDLEPANTEHLRKRSHLAERLAYLTGDPAWFSKGMADLESARKLNPRGIPVMNALYRFYAEKGDLEPAEEVLEALHGQTPYSRETRSRLAQLKLRRGKPGEAAELVAPVAAQDSPEARLIVASVLMMELQEEGRGLQLLRDWSADRARKSLVDHVIGQIHQIAPRKAELARIDDALFRFQRQQAPDDPCVLLHQAQTLKGRGNTAGALQLLDQVVDSKEAHRISSSCCSAAVAEWASLMAAQGEGERAQQVLTDHLRDSPSAIEVRLQLSRLLKDRASARALIKEGLALREDQRLLRRMGELYEADGLQELASNYYRDADRLSGKEHKPREGGRPAEPPREGRRRPGDHSSRPDSKPEGR